VQKTKGFHPIYELYFPCKARDILPSKGGWLDQDCKIAQYFIVLDDEMYKKEARMRKKAEEKAKRGGRRGRR
jgi:hypothetical protein